MHVAKTILTLLLFSVCIMRGSQTVSVLYVCGDVPKPGSVNLEEEGMTIESAMAKVGMDLTPFYADGSNDHSASRCPIRVVVLRQGEKKFYDPSVDAAQLRALSLKLNDTIAVTDLRQHPKKIENRKQRIERMLERGSPEIADELSSLATLRHEYDEWRGDAGAAKTSDEYLRAEAVRLTKEGKGQKIVDILNLKLGSLQLDGLGPAHPVVKSTTHLIKIFRDITTK